MMGLAFWEIAYPYIDIHSCAPHLVDAKLLHQPVAHGRHVMADLIFERTYHFRKNALALLAERRQISLQSHASITGVTARRVMYCAYANINRWEME